MARNTELMVSVLRPISRAKLMRTTLSRTGNMNSAPRRRVRTFRSNNAGISSNNPRSICSRGE